MFDVKVPNIERVLKWH
jgi:hypothetical protein